MHHDSNTHTAKTRILCEVLAQLCRASTLYLDKKRSGSGLRRRQRGPAGESVRQVTWSSLGEGEMSDVMMEAQRLKSSVHTKKCQK